MNLFGNIFIYFRSVFVGIQLAAYHYCYGTIFHLRLTPLRLSQFEALGINAILDRSFAKGLMVAAAVLRAQNIDEKKISSWMKRQQSRALDEKKELTGLSGTFPCQIVLNQEG